MQMVRQDGRCDGLERSCFLYVFPGRTEIRDVIDEQAALAILQVQREEICSARNVEPSIIWQSIPPRTKWRGYGGYRWRSTRPTVLYTGEGLPEELQGITGQDLDYAIVSIEQTLVQSYIDNAIPERHRTRFINEATRGISISPASTVRKVVESYDGAFDFSNQNHREAIGRALVDKHRNEHFSVD